MTRLLLRKTNKIFSHNELSIKYSSELGEDNVAAYMDILTAPLDFSQTTHEPSKRASWTGQAVTAPGDDRFFTADELASLQHFQTTLEPQQEPDTKAPRISGEADRPASTTKPMTKKNNILKTTNDASNPIVLESSDDDEVIAVSTIAPASIRYSGSAEKIDMKKIATGLTKEEEARDPELARAIRMSKYEALKQTVAVTGASRTMSSGHPGKDKASATSLSNTTDPSKASDAPGKLPSPPRPEADDFYRLKEGDTEHITAFARGAAEMTVEEMIRHLNMAELTVIAKELKCWKSKYTVSGIYHP